LKTSQNLRDSSTFRKTENSRWILSGAPLGFVAAADLAAANSRVVEFRDNNVALKKQVDELLPLKTKYEGIDPDAARAALAAQDELKKKGVTKPEDIAAMLDAAVKAAVKPLTEQITSITTTSRETQQRADSMTLRQTLSDKFLKAGGVPEALDFIVSKAAGVFVVDGGTVKAAANKFSTDKPGEPLSIDEWMTSLTKESAFAFKSSAGGGANPLPSGGGPTRPAGQLVLKNPTAQQLGSTRKTSAQERCASNTRTRNALRCLCSC
jgi:hypothetical protein